MAHIRKQIREAVAAAVTSLTTTGTNVFQSRAYAFDSATLPCLAIYTTDETSEIDSIGTPRGLYRTLMIKVEGRCRATSDVDDTMDLMCKEVEVALGSSTLSGLAKDFRLAATTMDIDRSAEQPTGLVVMTWVAEYRTSENDPETSR
jgi:hypothetical protein